MRYLVCLVFCLILSIGYSAFSYAEEEKAAMKFSNEVALDEDLAAMIRQRVAAINNHDRAAYLETIHPKCLAAMSAANQDYYDKWFNRDLAKTIPPDYKISVTSIASGDPLLMEGQLEYPVRPTRLVMVDYQTGPNASRDEMWQVMQEGGRWYVVVPKPTPFLLDAMRKKQSSTSKVNSNTAL